MWLQSITPRFGDTDGLKHINNCMLPIWFENARTPIFKYFHPDLSMDVPWQLIIARISVDFVSQMRYGTDVEVRTFIKKLGRSSITVYQEALQDGVLGAKGEAIIVHFDYESGKSLAIPDDIRRELDRHMVDPNNPNLRTRSGRFPGAAR